MKGDSLGNGSGEKPFRIKITCKMNLSQPSGVAAKEGNIRFIDSLRVSKLQEVINWTLLPGRRARWPLPSAREGLLSFWGPLTRSAAGKPAPPGTEGRVPSGAGEAAQGGSGIRGLRKAKGAQGRRGSGAAWASGSSGKGGLFLRTPPQATASPEAPAAGRARGRGQPGSGQRRRPAGGPALRPGGASAEPLRGFSACLAGLAEWLPRRDSAADRVSRPAIPGR